MATAENEMVDLREAYWRELNRAWNERTDQLMFEALSRACYDSPETNPRSNP